MITLTLDGPEVELVYDVRGPLPTADGRQPLVMIGQPMDASGFGVLAGYFPDRTVVTYDPRGIGRSARRDGRVDHSPDVQAQDVHALIKAIGGGPVEMFASSGGAVTALVLVAAHPDDVSVLVDQRLSTGRGRADRGADPVADRRRCGVIGHLHRADLGGNRRAARPATD